MEQSAAVFSTYSGSITVTPFVGLGLVLDTKGYEWNNKVQPRIGMKVNKYFRKGVVSVGSAYSYEHRFKSFDSSGLTVFVQDWFGWQPVAEKSSRFPGSSWMEVGNLSPVEKGNILGLGYVTQGVVAKRFSRATVVPYVEATVFHDSKGFDWDNKATVGGGVKAICRERYLHRNRCGLPARDPFSVRSVGRRSLGVHKFLIQLESSGWKGRSVTCHFLVSEVSRRSFTCWLKVLRQRGQNILCA